MSDQNQTQEPANDISSNALLATALRLLQRIGHIDCVPPEIVSRLSSFVMMTERDPTEGEIATILLACAGEKALLDAISHGDPRIIRDGG